MVDSVIASPAAAPDSSASTTLTEGEVPRGERTPSQAAHARRISYFMLFRLAVLSAFTILAGLSSWYRSTELESFYEWVTWGTLGVGYFLTLLFAWTLPRVQNLASFAWGQTAIDIVLAAVVVQLSGGVDSGFVFLYLVAILGAATMGDRQQTWSATGVCFLIYGTMSLLQATGVVQTMSTSGEVVRLTTEEFVLASARTSAGIAGVGILSAYLNVQLWSSVHQVGSLRALNENIVRSLTSGLVTVDVDDRILFANPTARAIIGFSGDVEGDPVDDLIPGVAQHLADSGGGNNRFELELRRHDGRTMQLGLNCAPLLDVDGRFLGHVLHFQDVTELHDLARRARRHERLAAIGGLAASVAHEVRNPLAAISGSAELLQTAVSTDDDRKLLDVIKRESDRLEKTVSDLLAFTRPKKPEPMRVDLVSAVREILEAFGADPANEQLRLSLQGAKSLSAEVDPSQFSQIVWNLLRNAAEATSQRGGIEVRLAEANDDVVLTIKDDGPGIPPEERDRIFEPFFSTKAKGSGFGLALIHRIVQEHGGEISVHNEADGGACFTVRLPRQRA
jgi:two-component system sensor histidine kinase PilS (NtrC family)